MTAIEPIRVAVVGLGRAGWDIHIKRMRGHPEFQITAVADMEADRCAEAEREFHCATFREYQSLLQHSDAELVVVATQSHTHAEVSCAALAAGRHVVVEKPMATSVADARRMVAAARAAKRRLFVHQNYRYYPDSRHLLETVRSRQPIGEVFEIRMRILTFMRRNDWQTLKKYGGGVLNNTGAHFVDLALLLLAAPVRDVWADLKQIASAGDVEDHVKLLIRARNGRVADIELSTACAFSEPKFTLLGTNGTLVCDGKTSRIKRFDPSKVQPLPVIESPPVGRRYGNEDRLPWEEFEVPAAATESGDFYDNVVAVLRHRARQEITPQSVIEVMKVVERAKRGTGF